MNVYDYKPFQFYNLDFNPEQYFAIKYYINKGDKDHFEKPQKMKKMFIDIEVFNEFDSSFPDPNEAKKPINAVTLIPDTGNNAYVFLLKNNFESEIDTSYSDELKKQITKDYNHTFDNIELNIYDDEKELLQDLFKKIHEYDPVAIMGFNSDSFDIPYIINRLINLFGEEHTKYIVSKFGIIKKYGNEYDVPDYKFVDQRKLYTSEGFGFGKSLEKYSLDSVAEEELGVKKIEYDEYSSLDELYIKNPKLFVYYNVVDVLLLYKLDKKLDHLTLFNDQRRITYCPFTRAYHGRSIMGESYQTYFLIKDGKLPRSFLVKEKIATFIHGERTFQKFSLSLKYYGAYVKDPGEKKVIKGIIIDLDQTSMYPSIDKMFNISFETYSARVYDSYMDKTFEVLKDILDNRDKRLLEKFRIKIHKMIDDFIEKLQPQNKKKYKNINKEYIDVMLNKIYDSGLSFDELISTKNYYISKTKFIPLLEIISFIHPESKEYCDTAYDFIFMDEDEFINKYKNKKIWILNKPTSSYFNIQCVNMDELIENYYRRFIITPAGTMFKRHDDQFGLLNFIVVTFMKLRKEFKKKRDSFDTSDPNYQMYDNKQLSTKILLNAISYGVTALTTFRYNERNIANTITICGRILLKTAQYIANKSVEECKIKTQ